MRTDHELSNTVLNFPSFHVKYRAHAHSQDNGMMMTARSRSRICGALAATIGIPAATMVVAGLTAAQVPASKPNILFIMGVAISAGCSRSTDHRGLMVGETPKDHRILGARGVDVHGGRCQSCTAGRNAFFTGMYTPRTRHDPAAIARQPDLPFCPAPALAVFLHYLGYNTGE